MISILAAASISLFLVLLGTPFAIRLMRQRNLGQYIREDGPQAHIVKKGTPTMGGLVIITGAALGYLVAHLRPHGIVSFTSSGLLAVGVILAMGGLGFIDDYLKVTKKRSLGLSKTGKLVGQLVIALGFAWLSQYLQTQAQVDVSFVRPLGFDFNQIAPDLGLDINILFVAWVFLIISAASNGVNFADGLDGLASGSGAMIMGAYVIIAFWQARHSCNLFPSDGCYVAPDSLDLAMVAAGMLGACAGFLWWNAAPAKIFMGDTGAMAIGGTTAVLAVLTNTQLLLIVLGGLYVVEVTSVVVQVVAFRTTKKRVFLMAPIHHHFELRGWPEFTVIVRFWILAGLSIALGLGIFYADFIASGGVE